MIRRLLEWLMIDLPFHPKHTDWEAVEREVKAAQERAAAECVKLSENPQKYSDYYPVAEWRNSAVVAQDESRHEN